MYTTQTEYTLNTTFIENKNIGYHRLQIIIYTAFYLFILARNRYSSVMVWEMSVRVLARSVISRSRLIAQFRLISFSYCSVQ